MEFSFLLLQDPFPYKYEVNHLSHRAFILCVFWGNATQLLMQLSFQCLPFCPVPMSKVFLVGCGFWTYSEGILVRVFWIVVQQKFLGFMEREDRIGKDTRAIWSRRCTATKCCGFSGYQDTLRPSLHGDYYYLVGKNTILTQNK